METDHNKERESKRRKLLFRGALCGAAFGAAIMLGGPNYAMINYPIQPPLLEEYNQIVEELDRRPQVSLRDLGLRSSEIIVRADKLKAREYIMASDPDLVKAREEYEIKIQNNERILAYAIGGGAGLVALSSIPLFWPRRKTRKRGGIETDA